VRNPATPLARWAAVASLLAACQALVGSELETVRCQEEGAVGPPACPEGQACQQGRCRACANEETCDDQVDNDCDGEVDDGCAAADAQAGAAANHAADGGGAGGDASSSAGAAGTAT
jgi:hypothetical protein